MAESTKNMTVGAGSASASVTATVTDQMPDVPCPTTPGYTYTGMRYVPVFADPPEWSSANSYEALEIVTHEGSSYTSKTFVPVGIDISDPQYWVLTGNYNAQVEQYRQEVAKLSNTVDMVTSEYVKAYDTVADMKADTSIEAGMLVKTVEYAAGQGGGAFYLVGTTGTANGMDIIATGNGLICTLQGDTVTPQMLGAKADGSADASAIIQRCFQISKQVVFDGVYGISSITIPTGFVMTAGSKFKCMSAVENAVTLDNGAQKYDYSARICCLTVDVANMAVTKAVRVGIVSQVTFFINVVNFNSYGVDTDYIGSGNEENLFNVYAMAMPNSNSTGVLAGNYDNTLGNVICIDCMTGVEVSSTTSIEQLHCWSYKRQNTVGTASLAYETGILNIGLLYNDTMQYAIKDLATQQKGDYDRTISIQSYVNNWNKTLYPTDTRVAHFGQAVDNCSVTILGAFTANAEFMKIPLYETGGTGIWIVNFNSYAVSTTNYVNDCDSTWIPANGTIGVAANAANLPTAIADKQQIVISNNDGRTQTQMIFGTDFNIYMRSKLLFSGETWKQWRKFTGTV
jgi:hypothetical protein